MIGGGAEKARVAGAESGREVEEGDRVPFSVKVRNLESCLFRIPVGLGACLFAGDLELRKACVAGIVAPTPRIGPAVQ